MPTIRFKNEDGSEYPEWEERKLVEVATLINGRAYSQHELLDNGQTPVLRVGNFFTNNNWYYSDLDLDESKYADYGDLLYAWSATFGPRIWQGDRVIFHYHIWKVIPADLIRKNFLFHWFMFDVEKVKEVQTGGTMHHVTKGNMEERIISCPTLGEQEKIATFLSTIDSRIEVQSDKVGNIEEMKKGLMQKLFSQEIRFRREDGSEYPEWVETELKEVAEIYDGTHQTPTYVNEGVRFLSVENIKNFAGSSKFITRKAFEDEFKVSPKLNDILMTRIGDIGTPNIVTTNEDFAYYVSLALLKCKNNILPQYLLQYIKCPYFQNELHKRTLHIAFPKKINKGEIGECTLEMPIIEEQQKIATFLSTIDEKIELEKDILGVLTELKKGLLQQMFV